MLPVIFAGYGDVGSGKTCDVITAAPNSLYIAEAHAVVHPAKNVWGLDIPPANIIVPPPLHKTPLLIKQAAEKGFKSVIIDDLSLIASQTFRYLEGDKKSGGLELDGFPLFKAFRTNMAEFRDTAQRCGIYVLVNAHLGLRHLDKLTGQWIKGGPKLPGQAQQDTPAVFDTVLRIEQNPARPVGWTFEYHCGDNPDFITKDRLDVVFGAFPMNIGEIMRARGHNLPRFPGLEWLDEAIPAVAKALMQVGVNLNAREHVGAFAQAARRDILSKYTDKLEWQNWALRDAIDRVIIRTTLAQRASTGSLFGG